MDTKKLANKIRIQTLKMTNQGKTSHIGSIFSIVDVVTVLYNDILKFNPQKPKWNQRDRFILSKGHAGAAVYAILAEQGFFPVKDLDNYYQDGSRFSGHISHYDIPGVELSTGALGHGLPVASGMALNAKLNNQDHRIFVILSDGECNEGSVWESALFAGHHKLDNLVVIVDYNKIQCTDRTDNIICLEPFVEKWQSFGFEVAEVDGHDHDKLKQIFNKIPVTKNKPTCVIAHTTKGKGVSFMEDTILWHFRTVQDEEYQAALKELEDLDKKL